MRRVRLDGSQVTHGRTGIDCDVPKDVIDKTFQQKRIPIVQRGVEQIRNQGSGGRGARSGGARSGALGLLAMGVILNELSGGNDGDWRELAHGVRMFEAGSGTMTEATTIALALKNITGSNLTALAVFNALDR